jgi:hypothetical protein
MVVACSSNFGASLSAAAARDDTMGVSRRSMDRKWAINGERIAHYATRNEQAGNNRPVAFGGNCLLRRHGNK